MTTHAAVKTSAWIEQARALAPIIEQWRDVGEQDMTRRDCHRVCDVW
jgi:hypothetical protein